MRFVLYAELASVESCYVFRQQRVTLVLPTRRTQRTPFVLVPKVVADTKFYIYGICSSRRLNVERSRCSSIRILATSATTCTLTMQRFAGAAGDLGDVVVGATTRATKS